MTVPPTDQDELTPPVQDQDELTPPVTVQEPAPSLADAVLQDEPAPTGEDKPARAVKLSNPQIQTIAGALVSRTIPKDRRKAFLEDFCNDEDVRDALEAVDLAGALDHYGVHLNGGSLPPWASLILGTAVLGAAVFTKRGKYVQDAETLDNSAGGVAGPGDAPGAGTEFPVSGAASAFSGLTEPAPVGG